MGLLPDQSPGEFAGDLVRATAVSGAVVALITGFAVGWRLGGSVLLGAATGAGNLAVLAWLTGRMRDSAVEGESNVSFWGAILALKMFALLLVTVVAVLVVGASPFGFVAGYSLFLAAIGWRALTNPEIAPRGDESSADSD